MEVEVAWGQAVLSVGHQDAVHAYIPSLYTDMITIYTDHNNLLIGIICCAHSNALEHADPVSFCLIIWWTKLIVPVQCNLIVRVVPFKKLDAGVTGHIPTWLRTEHDTGSHPQWHYATVTHIDQIIIL